MSGVHSEVSWALNILGVLTFGPRHDYRLEDQPGILDALLHVVEVALGKNPPASSACEEEDEEDLSLPPTKRRKPSVEPGAPEVRSRARLSRALSLSLSLSLSRVCWRLCTSSLLDLFMLCICFILCTFAWVKAHFKASQRC